MPDGDGYTVKITHVASTESRFGWQACSEVIMWMDGIQFEQNETMVETTTLVGIYQEHHQQLAKS